MSEVEDTGAQTLINVGGQKITKAQARKFGWLPVLAAVIGSNTGALALIQSFDLFGKQAAKLHIASLETDKAALTKQYNGMLREWSYCMREMGAPLSPDVGATEIDDFDDWDEVVE